MPLQTSGAISLLDIQNEYGGSNPIGINEYYAGAGLVPSGTTGINGAIPTSGNPISFSIFYGSPQGETQIVNVGQGNDEFAAIIGYDDNFSGFGPVGTISDGTFNFLGGAAIRSLSYVVNSIGPTSTIAFAVAGTFSNSGWTNMNINGTDFTRASANFGNSGGFTAWSWNVTSSPFTDIGTNTTVLFT